ncbi:MAG: glycosyl hydrolase, partial [Phaeodactylibacter sp.]|nr:glycosyl hydrolase [Phaeodactylibacter sp.]
MKQFLVWAALIFLSAQALAQPQQLVRQKLLEGLSWRNIGPYRGGRCVAVAGVPSYPLRFYMGTTGGGIWKTEDAGQSWDNCSDGFFNTGSIGAIAVAPSDHNTIYAGTGEHPVRGVMTSAGDGVYKSQDGGRSWQYLGLKYARHISAIVVHPRYPDIVYVAVQGAVHGPSETRGVYRSMDGGMSWQKTLFINEMTG